MRTCRNCDAKRWWKDPLRPVCILAYTDEGKRGRRLFNPNSRPLWCPKDE